MLGILGGMGPLATVDFLRKLVERTPAARDQDHVPLVIYSVPQIPDRVGAILAGTESPLPAMLAGVRMLEQAGAKAIAIPCNTAHYWYADLQRESSVPLLHMADCACAQLEDGIVNVGLIGTAGTLAAGFYQQRLAARGYQCLLNEQDEIETWVAPGIGMIKAGEVRAGGALLQQALAALIDRGAQRVILACTETPLGLESVAAPQLSRCVDATIALADACIQWSTQNGAR
ncbi:MAG: aspartate/glutamate racemase family protein [Burkholderiales bacterium]|nr:aspartate/glutamate racemase family protein [Burkholderiales bacterium]